MVSLAYSLSYQGGSRNARGASLPVAYRVALAAVFLGLIGLDVFGVVRYSALVSTMGDVPIFGGLVKAFLVCGVAAALLGGRFAQRSLLSLGAVGSTVGFLALIAAAGWTLPAMFGHAARLGFPLVAALMVFRVAYRSEVAIRVLMSLTFLAHAFSGFGWPSPRPELFDVLISGTVGFQGGAATAFFVVVGVCNLLAAACLFSRRLGNAGLLYMAVWGLATSLAYPWACSNLSGAEGGWLRWGAEFLTRVPHFLLPVVLLVDAGFARGGAKGGHRRLDISRL